MIMGFCFGQNSENTETPNALGRGNKGEYVRSYVLKVDFDPSASEGSKEQERALRARRGEDDQTCDADVE